jgi:hypothetical protein
MLKPESKFQTRINKRIPHYIHRQKMGSAMYNGTADYWYSGNKADLWVEYKWLDVCPVKGVSPSTLLSALQEMWLTRRHQEGRNVCVIIGSPTYCALLTNGAWSTYVSSSQFTFSETEAAELIIESVYAPPEVSGERRSGDESDL